MPKELGIIPAERGCRHSCQTSLVLSTWATWSGHVLTIINLKIYGGRLNPRGRGRWHTGFMLISKRANCDLGSLLKRRISIRIGAVTCKSLATSSHWREASAYRPSSSTSSWLRALEFAVTATIPLYGAIPS